MGDKPLLSYGGTEKANNPRWHTNCLNWSRFMALVTRRSRSCTRCCSHTKLRKRHGKDGTTKNKKPKRTRIVSAQGCACGKYHGNEHNIATSQQLRQNAKVAAESDSFTEADGGVRELNLLVCGAAQTQLLARIEQLGIEREQLRIPQHTHRRRMRAHTCLL